jgi:hypothetical protein
MWLMMRCLLIDVVTQAAGDRGTAQPRHTEGLDHHPDVTLLSRRRIHRIHATPSARTTRWISAPRAKSPLRAFRGRVRTTARG